MAAATRRHATFFTTSAEFFDPNPARGADGVLDLHVAAEFA